MSILDLVTNTIKWFLVYAFYIESPHLDLQLDCITLLSLLCLYLLYNNTHLLAQEDALLYLLIGAYAADYAPSLVIFGILEWQIVGRCYCNVRKILHTQKRQKIRRILSTHFLYVVFIGGGLFARFVHNTFFSVP